MFHQSNLWPRSPEFAETWSFLDRRLNDLQAAPSLAQVLNLSQFFMDGFDISGNN